MPSANPITGPVTHAIMAMRNTGSASPFHGRADAIDWLRELPAKTPDADLLALGAQLDEAVAAHEAFLPTFQAAERGLNAAATAAASDLARLTGEKRDAAFYEIAEPFAADIRRGDILAEAIDALSDTIVNHHRPQTLAGVAVFARCVASWHRDQWEKLPADRNWDIRLVTELVDAVLRLAGVDRLGRPVTEGSV